jgi:RNA polymerase sigma-70 factor (ECF subfamily)
MTRDDAAKPPEDAGPPPDLAALVRAYWAPIARFLYRMTNHVHDAEDLTQETFLRALKGLDTFRPGTNVRAWLFQIACNAFLDRKRKDKRLPLQALPHEPPAAEAAVGQALETAEQAALVRAALEDLTDLTRMVFHLRVEEGLSFREIAELTGSTEQAARWHLHHARVTLLNRLRGRDQE